MQTSWRTANTCFEFGVSTVCSEWKQAREQKHPWGVTEGRGCLRLRQAHWLHTWMVLGGDPSTVALSVVATDNGLHWGGGGGGWQIMWCGELRAHWLHRTATLIIWATFLSTGRYEAPDSEAQAQTYNILPHCTLCLHRYHRLWTTTPWLNHRNPSRLWKTGSERREMGARLLASATRHMRRKSGVGLIVSDLCWSWKQDFYMKQAPERQPTNEGHQFRAQDPSSSGVPHTYSETQV